MPALHRAVASLRIVGDALDPADITRRLGGEPTRAWKQGDELRRRPDLPSRPARHGQWRREASQTQPEDLGAQLREVLRGLTPDLEVWRTLSRSYRVDLFCGWFMKEGNEGVEISPEVLQLLAERHIALNLDIYASDDDA